MFLFNDNMLTTPALYSPLSMRKDDRRLINPVAVVFMLTASAIITSMISSETCSPQDCEFSLVCIP
jgi:hypothetical protein